MDVGLSENIHILLLALPPNQLCGLRQVISLLEIEFRHLLFKMPG